MAYENRKKDRLDSAELDSLLKLKNKFADLDVTSAPVKGFIQVVSVDPVIVLLWTRAAVKIFHDLCKMDAVFWDATGHIVQSRLTTKKLFYYELTIRNPTTGKVSLPLSMMISSDQTQPTIQYWLATFRNNEKMLYGSDKVSQPIQVNSDRAMGFILSALQVFNGETFHQFLQRAWRIVLGKAENSDLTLTIVHSCAFHFMRNSKDLVKKSFKTGSRAIGMWMLSLLMNTKTMEELNKAVLLIIWVTSSQQVTEEVRSCVSLLNKLLKDFRTAIDKKTKECITEECSNVSSEKKEKSVGAVTEEEFVLLATNSPFKRHTNVIYQRIHE